MFLSLMITSLMADTFSVQGVLRDPLGKTVPDYSYQMTFTLYNSPTGGDEIWTESLGSVQIWNGVYNVELGAQEAYPLNNVPFNETYWLGLSVEGGPELEPRIKLLKAPAAMSVYGTENVFPSVGNVGVGTPDPQAGLHIVTEPGDAALLIEDGDPSNPIVEVDANGNLGVRGSLTMGGVLTFGDGSTMATAEAMSTESVSSNSDALIKADADGIDGGQVNINIGTDTKMVISNGGNVGIGVDNPTNKLQVDGTIYTNNHVLSNTGVFARYFTDLDAGQQYMIDPSNTNNSARFAGSVKATSFIDEDGDTYFVDPGSSLSASFAGDVIGHGIQTDATGTYHLWPAHTSTSANLAGWVTATAFKDLSDTGYYLDPASSGVSANLAGNVQAASANFTGTIEAASANITGTVDAGTVQAVGYNGVPWESPTFGGLDIDNSTGFNYVKLCWGWFDATADHWAYHYITPFNVKINGFVIGISVGADENEVLTIKVIKNGSILFTHEVTVTDVLWTQKCILVELDYSYDIAAGNQIQV
ncbi:MAG: hypothetical protein H8E61_10035, partial [Bacteroidetes bacterium]|nr:hypothetical protein [Bacteroidota bacterium]